MFGLIGWQARLGEAALIIALLVGAYFYVYHKGHSEALQEVAVEQAKADKAQQDKYNLVAQELEDTKKKRQDNVRTITKTVEKIIDRPVYRDNPCMDSDGLHVINASLKGESSPKLDEPVPTSATP